ncbi:MAG: hypothetical protein ACKOUM_11990 [Sphingopyxis sp.]
MIASTRPSAILSRARLRAPALAAGMALGALVLAGCARDNEIDVTSGVGITATRSLCPAVGVPTHTGDMTLFDPPSSRDARAIDVVAAITNVRSTCNDQGERVYVSSTFDVVATRRDAGAARDVTLPYYSAVVQGGTAVVAKDQNQIVVHFADGQTRATASGTAGAYVDRAASQLPADISERITRRRRAGDDDAAIDPLAAPDVRAAIARSTFELLIGFQLQTEQLQYNVTR